MAGYRDLSSFLRALDGHGELRRVHVEVDPVYEITEIATRVLLQGGPALLFERVRGSPYPLAINLFASPTRVELALGRPPAQIGEEVAGALEDLLPPNPRGLLRSRRFLSRLTKMRTRRTRSAPAQEVEEAPDLDRMPILKCWPEDAGRFLTYPMVITTSRGGTERNVGVYRMQVYGREETGMHWQIEKGGGFHYHEAEKRNEPLEVAVAVGADPALLFAAMAPLPEGMDELAFAGFLRGRSSRVVRARTAEMDVPADAEFILEGVVPPHVRREEGPFGDHYGHYSHAGEFPVFKIRRMTRRRHPIYHAAVVGKPPQEDMFLGNAVQEITLPVVRRMHPEIRDLWAYYEGGFHTLLAVSVESRYEKEAVQTALGLLGEGQLGLSKCVIIVGPDVNPRDFRAVLRAIGDRFDPSRDFILIPGTAMDTLDFSSFTPNLGSKMILDATGGARRGAGRPGKEGAKEPLRSPASPLPDPTPLDPRIRRARAIEGSLLVVQVDRDGRGVLEGLIRREDLAPARIIAAVSGDVDLDDPVLLIWGIFTRFDPARDVFFARQEALGARLIPHGPMAIDATFKPGYPNPVTMLPEVIDRVSSRWHEYGLE